MDVRMPVLNGVRATRRLPRLASTAGVVMVATVGLDGYVVDRHAGQPDGLHPATCSLCTAPVMACRGGYAVVRSASPVSVSLTTPG
jgi:DNA-binding NarL/FixJ family response regulator